MTLFHAMLRVTAAFIGFLRRKWAREFDYALRKDLWSFDGNRIAVRFRYECHDAAGQWFRSYGHELQPGSRRLAGACNATGPDSVPHQGAAGRCVNTEVSYMRHRIGIVLAVIMAGALFFPGAWGYLRLLRLPDQADQLSNLPAGGGSLLSDHNVLLALAAVGGTALLAGILVAVPRVSPLAAGLPGLLLLGWTALYLVNVRQGVDLIPLRADPFGAGFEAMLFNGILAAAGLALILPMFVPSRWRSRPADDSDELEDMPEFTSGLGATRVEPVVTAPPTQFTPIRATTLAPIPAPPWHDPGDPHDPGAS
jgi:Protein of unknown function (DUF1348)